MILTAACELLDSSQNYAGKYLRGENVPFRNLLTYSIVIISRLIAVYLLDSDKELQNLPLMIAYIQTHLDSTCLKQSLCKRGEKTL